MCGLAGFITPPKGKPDHLAKERVMADMLARLKHRGPDAEGTYFAETKQGRTLALGHRRLSIIDVEGGKQPLSTLEGGHVIVFNGEVYNFQELRKPLEAAGARFATRSDTEVVLQHVARHREMGLADLNGMFAFALWDSREEKLTLARDRAGIKPLYYAELPDGGLAFASELTALLKHPAVPRKLSREALASYFFCDYMLAPGSVIEGVSKLEPGHSITWSNGVLSRPAPFWRIEDVAPRAEIPAEKELEDELDRLLSDAVAAQLVSDVPLGVFLSGGLDSSLVAAFARKRSGGPIRTFSIGFREASFDESRFAREVSRHIGSEHTEEILDEAVLIDTTFAALGALDEPLADPSLLPTYLLSELASRHVKVALGGDGGDELWAGYPTYRAHGLSSLYGSIPRFARQALIEPLVSALPVSDGYQSFEWKAKRFTGRWDEDPLVRHLRWMSSLDLADVAQAVPNASSRPWPLELAARPLPEDAVNGYLAFDFRTYLPGSVLTKVDRASMAHGLEARPPFLDNRMIQFAFSLPSHLKLRGGSGKHLLKRVARRHLPESIVDRPKKGFGIPLAKWLKGPMQPMVQATLRSSPLWEGRGGGILSRDAFEGWSREHLDRRADRSKPLWALIALDHWMKKEGIE